MLYVYRIATNFWYQRESIMILLQDHNNLYKHFINNIQHITPYSNTMSLIEAFPFVLKALNEEDHTLIHNTEFEEFMTDRYITPVECGTEDDAINRVNESA